MHAPTPASTSTTTDPVQRALSRAPHASDRARPKAIESRRATHGGDSVDAPEVTRPRSDGWTWDTNLLGELR